MKEKIIDQVYRNLPYSQRPKVDSVALGNLSAPLLTTAPRRLVVVLQTPPLFV